MLFMQSSTANVAYTLPGTFTSVPFDLAWLLLTAPKEYRLDLALASRMYDWTMELAEVIQNGKRAVVPIWSFRKALSGKMYHYTYSPDQTLPGIERLLYAQVPRYSRAEGAPGGAFHQLQGWLLNQQAEFELFYAQQAKVALTYRTAVVVQQEPSGVELPSIENRLATLLAKASLLAFAPELVPYLESDVLFVSPDLSFLPSEKHLQEIVLLPLVLPKNAWEHSCQYQEYDGAVNALLSCDTLQERNDEQEDAYAPDQCPACGGYYCQRHFSERNVLFQLTAGEMYSHSYKSSTELRVCRNCALLPDEQVQQVRAVRLAANKEKPYAPESTH